VNLYKTYTFAIPVPGSQGLTTKIKDIPAFLLGEPNSVRVGELSEEPRYPALEAKHVKWHAHHQQTCIWALVADRIDVVMQNCDFSAKKDNIDPTYVELEGGTYVVSNLTRMHASCLGETSKPPTSQPCSPCLIHIECGCSLLSDETTLFSAQTTRPCDNFSATVEVRHSVNLAILQSFYEVTNISLSGRSLLRAEQVPEHQALELKFFGEATDKLWAADEAASYSLKRLSESLKNDSVIMHTPAEAIVHEMLTRNTLLTTFTWTNWNAWLSILPWLGVITLAIWQCITHRKLSMVAVACSLQMCAKIPKARAYDLRTLPPTTTFSPVEWLATVARIRHFDMMITSYLLTLTAVVLVIIVILARAFARRTFLYIELTAENVVTHLRYFTLPDATRNYTVKMSKHPTRLNIRSFGFFGVVTFASKPWTLIHATTRQQIPLPNCVIVPFWQIRRLKIALSSPSHSVAPLIVHTHEYVYNTVNTVPVTDQPPQYV
jgi:hypothetical protein